jgi:hypothetical protein
LSSTITLLTDSLTQHSVIYGFLLSKVGETVYKHLARTGQNCDCLHVMVGCAMRWSKASKRAWLHSEMTTADEEPRKGKREELTLTVRSTAHHVDN